MGCYKCKYLKKDNKKAGVINGCLYYCTKIEKYVNGAAEGCDKYYKDYGRKTYEKDEIYNNGKKYYNDSIPVSTYLIIAFVLTIIAIIVNVF